MKIMLKNVKCLLIFFYVFLVFYPSSPFICIFSTSLLFSFQCPDIQFSIQCVIGLLNFFQF